MLKNSLREPNRSGGYRRKVILFPAGASGNFLANFLLVDHQYLPRAQFRIDYLQPGHKAIMVGSGGQSVVDSRQNDFKSPRTLMNIMQLIDQAACQIVISHYAAVSDLRQYQHQVWLRKIYPFTNVIGWIKNLHFKKQQLESVDYSQMSLSERVDQCQLFLQGWYNIRQQDQDIPEDLVLDFGSLYNLDYLAALFQEANGFSAPDSKLEWAQMYIDQQFDPIEDMSEQDLGTIVSTIQPKDFFDLAAALFVYEKNHNTVDQNRRWSIDDLPNDFDAAIDFLLRNQKNYTIFPAR